MKAYAVSVYQMLHSFPLQIKMARPQVSTQQQSAGQFGSQGGSAGRGSFSGRGGRGGRGYNQGYGYNQYGSGYDAAGYGGAAAGYGYDANGGYGYGGYSQYAGAGMQMVPMMLNNGQVHLQARADKTYLQGCLHMCTLVDTAKHRLLIHLLLDILVAHMLQGQ